MEQSDGTVKECGGMRREREIDFELGQAFFFNILAYEYLEELDNLNTNPFSLKDLNDHF